MRGWGLLTWTWSSLRRCWKSQGSVVRVAGPTSANTPAPPLRPQHQPPPVPPASAPRSNTPMGSVRAEGLGTCPGLAPNEMWIWAVLRGTTCPGRAPPDIWAGPGPGELQTQHLFCWGRLPDKQCRNPFPASASCPAPAVGIQTQCFCCKQSLGAALHGQGGDCSREQLLSAWAHETPGAKAGTEK